MDERFLHDIERARRMTPEERILEGFRLFEQGQAYIMNSIRSTFPEATDEDVLRICRIVIRRCKIWGIT